MGIIILISLYSGDYKVAEITKMILESGLVPSIYVRIRFSLLYPERVDDNRAYNILYKLIATVASANRHESMQHICCGCSSLA